MNWLPAPSSRRRMAWLTMTLFSGGLVIAARCIGDVTVFSLALGIFILAALMAEMYRKRS